MKLNTVNVIEFSDDQIIGLASYPDDKEGNSEAEKRFSEVAKENGPFDQEEIDVALDDGIIEKGWWKLVLFHSTV